MAFEITTTTTNERAIQKGVDKVEKKEKKEEKKIRFTFSKQEIITSYFIYSTFATIVLLLWALSFSKQTFLVRCDLKKSCGHVSQEKISSVSHAIRMKTGH